MTTPDDKLPDVWILRRGTELIGRLGPCGGWGHYVPASRLYALQAELEAALAAKEAAERELAGARKDADLLWANCKIVYFPASWEGEVGIPYPIEHNMRALGKKDSREAIIAALRRDAARAAQEGGKG